MAEERNLRVTRIGKVVSDKMQKTVVVAIEDLVKITQTRPLSKDKCWRVVEIVERAK